jgi:pimeloyl-ACP methyl ester carboxylesterase
LSVLPPADYTRTAADNETIAAVADPFARMRAAIDSVGGPSWGSLAEAAKLKRLNAMAATAPMVGPHMRGLNQLQVTDADVLGLRPPTLLLYGDNSFPFEAPIAARFRALRPDLDVVTVEKSGHNVHRDQSAFVNARALAFLA